MKCFHIFMEGTIMSEIKNPQNRGNCPFYVTPENPLTAKSSIDHCVNCVKSGKSELGSLIEDLRQIAYMTIIEETPKYDPDHPSGASYITFIKARVCTRLWSERQKMMRHIPFTHQDALADTSSCGSNPLIDNLTAQACAIESVADTVIQQIELETLQRYLPQLLETLTQKERSVIELKFFKEFSGIEIAEVLEVSEGRVSQLTKSALEKLGKAYLGALEKAKGNPYSDT